MSNFKGFLYDEKILETFPSVVGGVVYVPNIRNMPTPSDFLNRYQAEQAATIARIGETPLSEIASLAAWRAAFRAFGVNPTKYRSAAEALLRRLTKKGDIPSINFLVDAGNLISIRYGVPVAVIDTSEIEGILRVKFASGEEEFTELGSETAVHPEEGEVAFIDEGNQVHARRWCWRQSKPSAADLETKSVFIVTEGHHENAKNDLTQAVNDLSEIFSEFAGVETQTAMLNANAPTFEL